MTKKKKKLTKTTQLSNQKRYKRYKLELFLLLFILTYNSWILFIMPYEDNFKENTKFHSAHYFLNQFQSKDYDDSIIQLDGPSTNSTTSTSTTPVDPGLITVPIPSSSTSSTNNKRLDINSPEPLQQQQHHHQQLVLTLNTDLNEYMRGINKNKKKISNNVKDTPLSRTASTSPCLISPVFTNNESNTSPELELLEFEEDDDDDEEEEDDDDENEHWDQDEIFQMHGDGFSINPTVPGLFPQMDIGTNNEFMNRDKLPIEPMVHKRQ